MFPEATAGKDQRLPTSTKSFVAFFFKKSLDLLPIAHFFYKKSTDLFFFEVAEFLVNLKKKVDKICCFFFFLKMVICCQSLY